MRLFCTMHWRMKLDGKKKPDVSLHKMFTLNFTWADFILGLIDGSIMALIQLLALGLIARQHNISSTSCGNPTCREFYGTYCTSQSGLELRPKNFMAINIFHWIKNKVVNGALDVVSSSGSTFRSPSLFQLIYGLTKRLYLTKLYHPLIFGFPKILKQPKVNSKYQ